MSAKIPAIYFIILASFMACAPNAAFAAKGQTCRTLTARAWNYKISFRKIEENLKNGRIVSIKSMRTVLEVEGKKPSGSHNALLMTYEDGMKAVYKANKWHEAEAEAGIYQVMNKKIRSRMVPPTVTRDLGAELKVFLPEEIFENSVGSLQYFVKSSRDITDPKQWAEAEVLFSEKEKSDRDIFYFVFGQWDRHRGNLIVDDSGHMALIDNSLIKQRQQVRFGERPFIGHMTLTKEAKNRSWPDEFPFQSTVFLNNPTVEELRLALGADVEPLKFEKFVEHWSKRSDRTCHLAVWKDRVWIQSIGSANYPPLVPNFYSQSTLSAYRVLTHDDIREFFPNNFDFTDVWIDEILERRDQILKASETMPKIP
jgi:hypothetical protein